MSSLLYYGTLCKTILARIDMRFNLKQPVETIICDGSKNMRAMQAQYLIKCLQLNKFIVRLINVGKHFFVIQV